MDAIQSNSATFARLRNKSDNEMTEDEFLQHDDAQNALNEQAVNIVDNDDQNMMKMLEKRHKKNLKKKDNSLQYFLDVVAHKQQLKKEKKRYSNLFDRPILEEEMI